MFSNNVTQSSLVALGTRLRRERLARNDTQAVFAARIGVSVPTLRDMERGLPTVAVGAWAAALWMLDRPDDLGRLLAADSLFDETPPGPGAGRQRARRR
ncbi:MAG: helix-turn-helix domain-containing protein [Rhodocyclaceae bacterium]|nr:helix-turn-helix domain-containing protein [Rhodocyclaceae bacterium]